MALAILKGVLSDADGALAAVVIRLAVGDMDAASVVLQWT